MERGSIHMVTGNEGADMDSVVCAYLYSTFLSQKTKRQALPVINIPREELKFRPEVIRLLGEHNIRTDSFLFREDIAGLYEKHKEDLSIVLVDHNQLPERLQFLAPKVCSVIDHHIDRGNFPGAHPRIIEEAGSCISLVVREINSRDDAFFDKKRASLAAAAIAMDTAGLSPAAGRALEADFHAAKICRGHGAPPPEGLYRKYIAVKENCRGLTFTEIVMRDMKFSSGKNIPFAAASVPCSPEVLFAREGDVSRKLSGLLKELGVTVIIILFAYHNPDFTRAAAIYGKDRQLAERCRNLLDQEGPGLDAIEGLPFTFAQKDTSVSRKKMMPLLEENLSC